MGYWEMGEGGDSFVQDEDAANQMYWGDEPADIVAEALNRIKIAFVRDLGRMPSQKEIINGLKFTTNVLDEVPPEPKNVPMASAAQVQVAREHGYAAFGGDVEAPPRQQEAWKKIAGLLNELEIKPVFDEGKDKDEPPLCKGPKAALTPVEAVMQAKGMRLTSDTHEISEFTLVTDSLAWLDEQGYVGAVTATQPEKYDVPGINPSLLFRPADRPNEAVQMAMVGDTLQVTRDGVVILLGK